MHDFLFSCAKLCDPNPITAFTFVQSCSANSLITYYRIISAPEGPCDIDKCRHPEKEISHDGYGSWHLVTKTSPPPQQHLPPLTKPSHWAKARGFRILLFKSTFNLDQVYFSNFISNLTMLNAFREILGPWTNSLMKFRIIRGSNYRGSTVFAKSSCTSPKESHGMRNVLCQYIYDISFQPRFCDNTKFSLPTYSDTVLKPHMHALTLTVSSITACD